MRRAFAAAPAATQGILLFCGVMFLFSLMDVVAKMMTARYPPLEVVWARYASQFFWTLVVLSPRLRTLLRTRHLPLQLVRSSFLFCATFCFFNALKHLQFAEATAIFEIAPLVITLLSVVVLGEVVGVRRWMGVFAGMLGALLIIRPGTDVFMVEALYPVAAATCFAGYSISTRMLSGDEPPATSFLYTTLIGTIAASFLVPSVWVTPAWSDVPILATFGILGGIGHFGLIIALSRTEASVLAPFGYVALIMNAIWGLLVFSEIPDAWTWIGASIIVGSGLYVWHRERIRA